MKIKKLLYDDDDIFFELNVDFSTGNCNLNINIYTDNEELEKLRKGVVEFSNFKQKEFLWTTREDVEYISHFLSMRFFYMVIEDM